MNQPRTSCRPLHLLRAILPLLFAALALLLLVGVVSAGRADLPAEIAYDPMIAAVLARVATPTLAYELAGLTGARPVTAAGSLYTIATRHSYQTGAISMATRYAYEQLAATGLAVRFHDYMYNGYALRNVVAEEAGVIEPDEIYLITAHLDNMPPGPLAPGADDNASGSAAVLIAARLLAPRHFAHTVRFVLFTGEEQGLRGSAAYAAYCKGLGEDIAGVINLDMIGYNTGSPVFDLYARSGTSAGAAESRQLADLFSETVSVYGLNLIPCRIDSDVYPLRGGSDQWSFLNLGYPAILVIEDYAGGDFTPYYHTASDTLSTLDLEYEADLTRAAIAAIAHLGRLLLGGSLCGTVTDLETGRPISGAAVAAVAPMYVYTFTALTNASGVYSLSLPVSAEGFTIRAMFPGYYSTAITGVFVLTDAVAVQDVALAPWPRWYLPLVLQPQIASSR